MEFIKLANFTDLDHAVEWDGWFRGRAYPALLALARLGDDRDVKRKYLKAAKTFFGGNVIDFSRFTRYGSAGYLMTASTSNDRNIKTTMEKHVNKVWIQVQEAGALAYFGDGALANLGADTFARPRVAADGLIDNTIVEFDEGGKKHMALFNHGHAYVASWWGGVLAERESNSVGPLVITRTDFRPVPYTGVEMPGVIRGGSALDELLGASIANAVQNMLKAVRSRPKNMSIKNAVTRSLGYAGTYVLMRDNKSRKWLSHPWFDTAAALDPSLNKELEEMRDKLGMEDLEGTEFLQLNGHDRFNALPGTRTEILLRLKRLAFRGLDLAKRYSSFTGAFATDVVGNGVADAAGLAVTAGVNEVVAAVTAGDGEFVGARPAVVEGGADLCILGSCQGGSIYDVVPGDGVDAFEPGINQADVTGYNFSRRIGSKFDDLIRKISAAEAMIQTADASAQNKELQKLIADLHKELLTAFVAFQSHAYGSRQLLEADNMLRGQDQRMQLQEQLKNLVDISSGLAVSIGCTEYLGVALTEEESHISERQMRHSVGYRDFEINGQKVQVAMVRIKEHNKKSKYVALPLDVYVPPWQRLHFNV
jgi:hypothetical protein